MRLAEPGLWRLDTRPESLVRAAMGWRELAARVEAAGRHVGAAGTSLLTGWRGEAADAYRTHQAQTVDAFAAVSTMATCAARTMDDAADVMRAAQSHLDDAWRRLRRSLAHAGDAVHEAAVLEAAMEEAKDIRAHVDLRLMELSSEIEGARWALSPHTNLALSKEGELADWLEVAELASAGAIIVTGDRVIVNGTGGADDIRVEAAAGSVAVTVDGVMRRFPADPTVVVRAGGGNDTITVANGSAVRVTLLAGAGDDVVRGNGQLVLGLWGRDTIRGGGAVYGGPDGDYIEGGPGEDRVNGGSGDDTLYGLDGRDTLSGGRGRDYLDGGTDADVLAGGDGADVLMGGRGGDALFGGTGDDAVYSGEGADRVQGGSGRNRAYAQDDDVVSEAHEVTVELTDAGGFIRVEGSPEFVMRVQSDLDALRSSERGEAMLAALQRSHDSRTPFNHGNTLIIRESTATNGHASWESGMLGAVEATIDYNPAFDDLIRNPPVPPIVVLYHELGHIYDGFHDTEADGTYRGPDNAGVPNHERAVVGLPIDHDDDQTTVDRLCADHPFELTENGLREEFGLDLRTRY